MSNNNNALVRKPAGYLYLFEKLNITSTLLPHWHTSYISKTGVHNSNILDDKLHYIEDVYPIKYAPKNDYGSNLEFALKYDGINLNYLQLIFSKIDEIEITKYIQAKPTSKYARRIWFFYEFLTNKVLPISDLKTGNYTEALEPDKYFTITPGKRIARQRIIDNLLGDIDFCPIVRKTDKLLDESLNDIQNKCKDIISSYHPKLLKRALSYLYDKETKSSFEIENIKPNKSRTDKFIHLLSLAEKQDFCDKDSLIELQNMIVDPRFKDSNYRTNQNYVGQTVSLDKEIIHYISPKPTDIDSLMNGLIKSHQSMKNNNLQTIIHTAIIAYGFVFLHPFEDGNGRIHRFLIHNILSIQGFVPKGLMFPISSTMLKNQFDYDSSLESFSEPLIKSIEYYLNNNTGQMEVLNKTINLYKFMDLTLQAEALATFVSQTIKDELLFELDFLVKYDEIKKEIQNIIDMPDKLIDMFVKFCYQNNGKLSSRKKKSHFDFLTKNELKSMEQIIKDKSLYKTD